MINKKEIHVGIFTSFKNGGVRVYYETLGNSLRCSGCKVHFFTGNFFSCLFQAFRSYAFHREYSFVYLTYGIFNFIPFLPGPIVATFHGLPSVRNQGYLRVILLIVSLYYASLTNRSMISISFFTYSGLKNLFGIDTQLIRNCLPHDFLIDDSILLDTANHIERPIDILFLGRLIEGKLPLPYVVALADFGTMLNLNIAIAGKGDAYMKSISNQLARVGLEECISFIGDVSRIEARDLFEKSKVFISLSEFEPFGLVYLEAYVSGCQLVGPACGGYLEIASSLTQSQKSDFFYYSEPRPQLFIEAIQDALNSFSKSSRTSLHNRRFLADLYYGPNLQATAYMNIISKIAP